MADRTKTTSASDILDPTVATQAANYLNYLYSTYQLCVNHAAQTQSQQYIPSTSNTTTTGNILDGVCQKSSGANSFYYFGETDVSKGGGIGGCSCKSGFQFEHGNSGQCIAIPTKTNDQICQDSFGLKSNWDGTKNNQGGLNCSCQNGYQFNQGQTQCVSIPKTAPVKPITKKVPEIKAEISNTPTLTPVSSDIKVVTNTEPVKPKSFWARFVGWLGF